MYSASNAQRSEIGQLGQVHWQSAFKLCFATTSAHKSLYSNVWAVLGLREGRTGGFPNRGGLNRFLILLGKGPASIESAKTDLVRFKWGFGEGLLKGKFAFFEAYT